MTGVYTEPQEVLPMKALPPCEISLPPCEICGQPGAGAIYFDALTIGGTASAPSVIASGRQGRCAAHRPVDVPSLAPLPPELLPDPAADSIDLSARLMRCELRYSPEQEGDAPLTLTYQIDLSAHLAPPTMRPCQVCGQPATTIIVDMLDVTPPDAVAYECRPLFPAHQFCALHDREPVTYSLNRPASAP